MRARTATPTGPRSVSFLNNKFGAKALGLLHDVVPAAATIAFLVNPANPLAELDARSCGTTDACTKGARYQPPRHLVVRYDLAICDDLAPLGQIGSNRFGVTL
jgi:hypothetical protein